MPPQDAKVFATTQLDRLLAFFPRVDGKASFVLALNVALLGVMAVNFPIRHIGSPRACAGIIAALLLILSFWQLCVVFFPDLKSGEKRSLIYFGDIASLGWRGYHKALKDASEDDLLEDLTCQVWRNAEILRIKFDHTRSAMIFTLIALPFWLALVSAAALRAGKFAIGS
ncbi:hypothetical protein EIB18_14335 [Caulobacter vibrioides]|uniref:Pycsar effector protein domain-containing protein n=2 Tax=Caulobacter vibrioides TaxID=155892 RepID=Q9A4X1_CAUVC|nr:Pycsar system effector family protein [Caulobacter vibrioides]YP_002518160.1 hypothetical protein CCNA_02787 [Caulobacter vibrioides NA1000]AAK24669.1 hypothetical protein CC_2704 [Caulobacter vibrioides CB15]ACL96252.1 hypothetical protein CCNA_02787 [Caulobacter vibrioides NA1000]ATC29540.1 hypothetical protein CA607_14610 [Caulobacter vibrioides]AZH13772.1 hypothetical protein EIB18_14335 [Caulobacter vibrioides]QXZ51060.1 hypothetical protein KZH45_14365 [Caulobacter vibrioides]